MTLTGLGKWVWLSAAWEFNREEESRRPLELVWDFLAEEWGVKSRVWMKTGVCKKEKEE